MTETEKKGSAEDTACEDWEQVWAIMKEAEATISEKAATALRKVIQADKTPKGKAPHLLQEVTKTWDSMEPAAPYRRAMVDLLRMALTTDATLLEAGVTTCMNALTSGDENKQVTRRIRHTINELYKVHGCAGHAAYAAWRTRNPKATGRDVCIQGWDTRAKEALEAWDVPPEEWLRVLQGPTNADSPTVTRDTEKGTEKWRPDKQQQRGPPVRNMATWNNNSFFKRWRQGDLTRFLGEHQIDVLHITEVRGSTTKEDSHVLRRVLAELGFSWVAWNWNVHNTSNHGSAIFSRHPMEVEFGLHGDGTDSEGRVITTHLLDGPSVIWVYSPCSTMGDIEPEQKRIAFDANLKSHVLRTQTERGRSKVLVAGDLNVAPLATDSTVPMSQRPGYPSTKGYEIAAYSELLQCAGLTNAAEKSSQRPALTWRKKGYGHAMRLDHVLEPARHMSLRDLQDYYVVDTLYVAPQMYRSDHHPVVFSVRLNEPPPGPAMAHRPSRRKVVDRALNPRRLLRGIILEIVKSITDEASASREGYKRSRTVPEDYEATCWLDMTGEEYDETARRPGEAAIDRRGPVLPELDRKGDREGTFSELAALAAEKGAPAAACHAGSYRTDVEAQLPHFKEKACPCSKLPMGTARSETAALWDSGAYYNLMSLKAARRLGANLVVGGRLPPLEMANSQLAYPLGRVHIPVTYAGVRGYTTEFFVMETCPYDAIMGSHFIKTCSGAIDYETQTVRLTLDGVTVHVSFKEELTKPGYRQATAAYAGKAVTIPPHTEQNIEVHLGSDYGMPAGTWGWISDAETQPVYVQRGFTCRVAKGAKHWVRVNNPSSRPVTLNTAVPVAVFTAMQGEIHDGYDAYEGEGFFEAADEGDERGQASTCSSTPQRDDASPAHLEGLDLSLAKAALQEGEFAELQAVVRENSDLWDTRPKEPPPHAHTCEFKVNEGAHWYAATRPMGPPQREQLRTITRDQLAKHIIEPSYSPFSSAVVLVPKKGGGMRFAVDYRALNGHIASDSYTLPKVEEALSSLHGAKYFSSLDMKEAFWSVPLAEHCKQYTAFQTPDGLMQYRRMPMGLKTASAVFARYVDHMIGEMKFTNVLAYIDDLLIFSKTAAEHLSILKRVFKTLRKFNMTLGAPKCTLFAPSVAFLGHVVDEQGVHTDPNKVKAIREMPLPQTKKQMMSALGLMSYYRKFVRGYSGVEEPLRAKVARPEAWRKKGGAVQYTDEEMTAWTKLRQALMEEPILAHPDWSRPFELHCDGGQQEGLGAVLCQRIDGQERVISFASRSIAAAEMNYSVWELECLAIVWATRLFRMYLSGSKFDILTDSKAAAHVLNPDKALASGRMLRWALALQEFAPFKVHHRAGARHGNADGTSRNPLPSCTPYSEGPTDIEPGTVLDRDVGESAPMCTSLAGGPEAFFGTDDKEAPNAAEFALLQQADEWIQAITKKEITRDRYFRQENGLWVRKTTKVGALDQVLVPVTLRAFICRRYHGVPVSGHLGRRRSYDQIRRSYYWPGMYKDITRWIAACLACRQRKTPRPLKAGFPGCVTTATRPWQKVSIDIVSTNMKSSTGHAYILTILDVFTRYTVAVPLRRHTAREIGGALFKHLFCKFGKPGSLYSDEGKEFVNEAMTKLCTLWGIHFSSTGGYQPQANPVERFHRFLNGAMTMLSDKWGGDWPLYLPAAVFAYNASVNDATGFSPYELIFGGRKAMLLHDLGLGRQEQSTAASSSEHHFVQDAGRRLKEAYEAVRTQQERVAAANRKVIEAKRGVRAMAAKFEEGDFVLFWEPRQAKDMTDKTGDTEPEGKAPAKWKRKWSGPHVISQRTQDETGYRYTFYHKNRGVDIETHVNKLCAYRPWSEGLGSTSWDIDAKQLYNCGGWVPVGARVIVPLQKPYPFGMAEVIACTDDGDLQLQWLSNAQGRTKGPYAPGWTSPAITRPYYAAEPKYAAHVPYTTDLDGFRMNQRDVLMHGFDLTEAGMLPEPVLRAIAKHPYVWWDPLHDADERAKTRPRRGASDKERQETIIV